MNPLLKLNMFVDSHLFEAKYFLQRLFSLILIIGILKPNEAKNKL